MKKKTLNKTERTEQRKKVINCVRYKCTVRLLLVCSKFCSSFDFSGRQCSCLRFFPIDFLFLLHSYGANHKTKSFNFSFKIKLNTTISTLKHKNKGQCSNKFHGFVSTKI